MTDDDITWRSWLHDTSFCGPTAKGHCEILLVAYTHRPIITRRVILIWSIVKSGCFKHKLVVCVKYSETVTCVLVYKLYLFFSREPEKRSSPNCSFISERCFIYECLTQFHFINYTLPSYHDRKHCRIQNGVVHRREKKKLRKNAMCTEPV